jgi:hypothetical protein
MKRSILPVVTIFFFLCVFNSLPASAGFGDFLKGLQKTLLGKKKLSEADIINGLKQALEIGTTNAVKTVSVINGYYKNPKIRIPLPSNIQKVEKYLRAAGFGQHVDAFEKSMNRAAEKAAPRAKVIFWNAIKQIKFADARQILDGRDNEATLYFKEKTFHQLQDTFKPITRKAMSEAGVTRLYLDLNDKIRSIPFLESMSFDLDQYVTDRALDGLFLMLAEEEKKIREDPAARVTDLLKKVFQKN